MVELIEEAVANSIRATRGGRGGATIEELAEPSPRRSRTASSTASSPHSGSGNGGNGSYVQVQRADATA